MKIITKSPNLEIINYNDFSNYNFSNVFLLVTNHLKDYSDIFTKNILNCESLNLKNIVLISIWCCDRYNSNPEIKIRITYIYKMYISQKCTRSIIRNYKKNNPKQILKYYAQKRYLWS